jgi:hypothetical protein
MIKRLRRRKVRLNDGHFVYEDGNCSGQGGTFQQNTEVSVTGVYGTLLTLMLHGQQVKMLVLGDDTLLAVKGFTRETVKPMFAEAIRRVRVMGLNPEPVLSLVPSFCSALFWPIITGGVETFILAPEVSRFFARSGACFNWSKPSMSKDDAKAIVLGMVLSNAHWSHLPVLRVLANFVLKNFGDLTPIYTEEEHKSKQVEDVKFELSQNVGKFMLDVYGLQLVEVVHLEEYIASACLAGGCVSTFVSHPLLSKMAHAFAQARSS